jgi:glutathione S-transferase
MAITLYAMSGSPFTWKVHLALEHKQLPHEVRWLSVDRGDFGTPEFAALNPRKRAPILTDGSVSVYESEAIMRYLEAAHPVPTLFPGDLAARALAFRLVAEFDHYFAVSMEDLVFEILFKPDLAQRNQDKIASATLKLRAELEHFERELRRDFLAGALSAADFSLYPGIMLALRIEKRLPSLGISSMLGPRLSAWMKRIEALPYYDRTYPPHWRAK